MRIFKTLFTGINRDLIAVRNIKYLYDYYLGYPRKDNVKPRPEIFNRNQKFETTPLHVSNVTTVGVDP